MFSEDGLQSAGTCAQQVPDVTSARAIAISFMDLLYSVANSFGECAQVAASPNAREFDGSPCTGFSGRVSICAEYIEPLVIPRRNRFTCATGRCDLQVALPPQHEE